jgi:hypothetical protein
MILEKREHRRSYGRRVAYINVPVRCTISDISRAGARLLVDDPQSVPDVFVLQIGRDLSRWCKVVWRKSSQLAVRYVDPPSSYSFEGSAPVQPKER